jgi:hypothetical protein
MLKTLLGRRSVEDLQTFRLYVIAASFPKMLSRMANRLVSERYLSCLLNLRETTFKFIEEPYTAPTRKGNEDPDQLLFNIIPSINPIMPIPNLMQMFEANEQPYKLYNKDTYMEFHKLLCDLLNGYHQSLKALENLQKRLKEPLNKDDVKDILTHLVTVRAAGESLRAIVRGAAIEKHLKTIAHLLEVGNGKPSGTTTEEDTEEDTEFEVLRPYTLHRGQRLLPWQSYKDWLRLMIIYFDAVQILDKHANSSIDISIKILAPSLPDQKMLRWEELLRHKVYFPELIAEGPEQTSAETLISFLTSNFDAATEDTSADREEGNSTQGKRGKGTSAKREEGNSTKGKKGKGTQLEKGVRIEEVITSVQALSVIAAEGVVGLSKAIDSVIEQMTLLKNCSSPGWGQYIKTILEHIMDLKDCNLTSQQRLTMTQSVVEMLATVRGRSLLYQQLKAGKPLSRGQEFLGTRHCEACIASLSSLSGHLGPDNDQLGTLLSEFAVSRIFFSCLARIFVKFYNIGNRTSHRSV